LTFRQLLIDDPISIKKHRRKPGRSERPFLKVHSGIIAAFSEYCRDPSCKGYFKMFTPDPHKIFETAIDEHIAVVQEIRGRYKVLQEIAQAMASSLLRGGKVLFCGNGGSAADCQHLAAELVGRFRCERRGLPAVALTTDSSILTAVANDYGYESVFSRQVEALGACGDILLGLSTSGNSANVIAAFHTARKNGLTTVAFTGQGGGALGRCTDFLFAVASQDTARIQEAHILAGHALCDWVEQETAEMAHENCLKVGDNSHLGICP
jgi:D-sedoheptulose 7-phosphate isomerase